jgi:multisubunit Na+/H+ antiporter MnhG subunit
MASSPFTFFMNQTNTTEASVGATVGILGAIIHHLKLLGEIASPLAAIFAAITSGIILWRVIRNEKRH